MRKLFLIYMLLLLVSVVAAAPPQPPHRVYGDITDTVASEDNLRVEFIYSGNTAVETTTDSNGAYDVKIPYDSNYAGQQLSMHVEGKDSGKTVTFSSGSSTELNYEGENLRTDDFDVSGTITANDSSVDNLDIAFYYDSSEIASGSTDGSGDYSITVPFGENYNTKDIELYVDGDSTGKTVTFESGGSAQIDYELETTTQQEEDQTNQDNTDENTAEEDNSGTTNTDDSDNTDDSSSDDSDSGDSSEGAVVEITDISSSPENPEVGDTVEIYVTLTNTGDESTDYDLSVNVGGEELTKTVENLEAGDTELVTFEKEFDAGDTYAISVGEQSHSISVGASQGDETQEEKEDGGLGFIQIMGIVGGLLMLIVVVYLFIDSRRGEKDIDEEQKGALEAFKEKKKKDKEDDDGFGWKYANDD